MIEHGESNPFYKWSIAEAWEWLGQVWHWFVNLPLLGIVFLGVLVIGLWLLYCVLVPHSFDR